MRVLLDDVLTEAAISATNQSVNYPVSNLTHPFLRKRYQNTTGSATVFFNFESPFNINCIFVGYSSINHMNVKIDGALVYSKDVIDPNIEVIYLDALYSCTSLEISFNGLYIGKISAGIYTQFPNVVSQYETGLQDNSNFFESAEGQTLVNSINPLRVLSYSIRELEDVSLLGKYRNKPIFFDLYEFARWKEEPIYGRITTPFKLGYNPRRYDLSNFTIKECR